MKILVFSDSHGDISLMGKILENIHNQISLIIHLGDFFRDTFKLKNFGIEIKYVSGNCDMTTKAQKTPSFLDVEFFGKKVFATHGHTYYVKSGYGKLSYAALKHNADVCLFGHTHEPVIFEEEGILFVNPGSIGAPRFTLPSYAVLDVSEDGIYASIVGVRSDGLTVILSQSPI